MDAKRFTTRAANLFRKKPRLLAYLTLPRGLDVFYDLKIHLPHLHVKMVFDVGANTGQSAKKYVGKFPGAKIHSFEPVQKTFLEFQKNLLAYPNVQGHRLALSSAKGSGTMVLEGSPDMFSLVGTSSRAQPGASTPLEEVPLETLDGFCRDHQVDRINYLKIDTEGNDFAVLQGATDLLAQHRIDVVEVEAGMNSRNTRHVPLEIFSKFFDEKNYFLFGIYEQTPEFLTRQPHLRRTNCVFISDQVIAANPGT